jgi:CheY-like chemotaxis protein
MTSRYGFVLFPLVFLLLLPGCATKQPPPLEMTQLQVRQLQTRTLDVDDSKIVMKVIIHVLQDEGFIIEHANTELGIIHAIRETKIQKEENTVELLPPIFDIIFGKTEPGTGRVIVDCTANVIEYGNQCRVRLNFQKKVIDEYNDVIEVKIIDEHQFYQMFFNKIDKGIFLKKEKL